jgi:protein-disulfide isomerase
MSNKREREKRREQRLQEETRVDVADRRTRLLQLGAGAVFLVIVAVAVLIVVNASSSDSGGDTELEEVGSTKKLFAGIPQENLVLGDPSAPVEITEFGDLQCPFCKAFSVEVLPQVVETAIAQGKARIEFRNFTIIGPQSTPAGQAALAAGAQGRGWQFLELFYRNQGKENTGYANDAFLRAVAEGAGVPNIAKWNEDRKAAKLSNEVAETTEEAQQKGFTGTPSFLIKGPGTNGSELMNTPTSPQQMEEEIEKAS